MITILKAPAYLTVQDAGRHSARAHGVPVGGAMDTGSLAAANVLVGNAAGAPALEWSLTGGALRFERDTVFALAGAHGEATLDGEHVTWNAAIVARAGGVLAVSRPTHGRFLYLAVSGGLDVPVVLGGRGTYLPGRFGGWQGRILKTGDVIPTGKPSRAGRRVAARDAGGDGDERAMRFVRGPDATTLPDADRERFSLVDFTLAHESDRIGYRMRAADFAPTVAAGARSSPSCVGAIQITPAGEVIVLMADAPTISGYAKIGVVVTTDVGRLAQRTPGARVRFAEVTLADARAALAEERRAIMA